MLKRNGRLVAGKRNSEATERLNHGGASKQVAEIVTRPKQQGPNPERKLQELASRIRACTACPLCQSRTLAVPGEGPHGAKVMIIGEGPGSSEDKTGRPFVGNAGRYLEHVLQGSTLTREDFFITNIVKCRPPANRTPQSKEVETCTSLYLHRQIELVSPRLILLLGGTAAKKMLGLKNVEQARGKLHELGGRRYLATYHPAVRFYREDLAAKIRDDFELLTKTLKRLDKA